jgi:type IV pilus assembly protein PilO
MKKIDFSKITDPLVKGMDRLGKLPKLYRILISLGIIVVAAAPLVYFSYMPKWEKKKEITLKIADLEQKLMRLQTKARQLKAAEKKLKDAENEFKIVMKALPEKKEIPNLLANVSRSGQDAGLEFVLFEPKMETAEEFYAVIPVSIKVSGNYHNVAMFFDKVSRLHRIVNIDNINITAQKDEQKGLDLATSCTALTYRFVDQEAEKSKK